MRKSLLLGLIFSAGVVYAQGTGKIVPVTFQFVRAVSAPDVGIGLNGGFNNWGNNPDGTGSNAHLIPMTNAGSNLWTVTINLVPGTYTYKFVTYKVSAAGDTSVDSWFTDPLNSNVDGSGYYNSIVYVSDPMIYYLLPLNNGLTNTKKPDVAALVSWATTSSIAASSLSISLDGQPVANASQYFDAATRKVDYVPSVSLSLGSHSVVMSVSNTDGATDTVKTTFTVTNAVVSAPYTFRFDPHSPNLKLVGPLESVAVKGAFNNFGADPLTGPDSDGVYSYTVPLNIGVPNSYQYIINGGQYIDDPDNPIMDESFETVAIKQVNPKPSFVFVQPRQGQIFVPGSVMSVKADLMMSDSGIAINKSSVAVSLDGTPVAVAAVDSTNGGVSIQTSSFTLTQGRHQLAFTGADANGNSTTSYLTFGAFPSGTGFHYVDADFDDYGSGKYTYPSFSPKGTADLKEIDINTNVTNDSLVFTATLGAISDNSRVTFEILNSLGGPLIMDPNNAGIQIPDYINRGVYFVIAAPNSSALSGRENEVYDSTDIFHPGIFDISVNQDAKSSGVFTFSIPISLLESYLGTFASGWHFIAFTTLGNSTGDWKVPQANGGSFFDEQPNVYDAAFFYNSSIEKRNLADFNYSFNYGGSKYVKLASDMRGALLIKPGDISSAIAGKPYVKILTDGGNIRWSDSVTVFVAVSDSSITSGTMTVGAANLPITFTNDTGAVIVPLQDGMNELQASVQYGSSNTSYSTRVFFNSIRDHRPQISITKSAGSGSITLDASATTNIDGLPQSYLWTQDAANPQRVSLAGASSAVLTFSTPTMKGEYYYTLHCATSKDSSFERVVLEVDSTGAYFPGTSDWHAAWVDSAIIYEVYVKTMSVDGDFTALTNRIQQIKSLGVNTIWLMPIYPGPQLSPSQPGYAITNYFNVNPVYGTLGDFKTFVDSAHANGIRVMLDYVVNHTHNTHPFMLDAMKYGKYSPYRNFYNWNADGSYAHLYTWTDLPSINYDSTGYQQNMKYLIGMAKYWVENYNIDGFRCDVAWGVNDLRQNGPMFWQEWRQTLKTIKPDLFLLGEMDATRYYAPYDYFGKKFDSGYDYSTITAIRNAFDNSTLTPQLDSAEAYYASPSYPSYAIPMHYIENHDEPRFVSQYSLAQTRVAATLDLTLPGVPLIYAGQEVGEQTNRGMIDWSDPNGLLPFYKKLVSIRKDYNAFETGKYFNVSTTSPDSVFAFARVADSLSALVLNNVTGGSVKFDVMADSSIFNLEPQKQYFLNDVLNGAVYPVTASSIGNLAMTLGPNSSDVLILSDKAFVTSVKEESVVPLTYELYQNYPNPFNPTTTIQYSIADKGLTRVQLTVYNVLGQTVKTLVDDYASQGIYRVVWNGRNESGNMVASGVYFYMLKTNSFIQTKKMLLLK